MYLIAHENMKKTSSIIGICSSPHNLYIMTVMRSEQQQPEEEKKVINCLQELKRSTTQPTSDRSSDTIIGCEKCIPATI